MSAPLTSWMCAGPADAGGVIESFCLTFTAGLPGIGEPVSAPLCEDGDDVAVTADNRREYVDAYVDCILNTSVEKQVAFPLTCSDAPGVPHLCVLTHLRGVFQMNQTQDIDFLMGP